MLTLYLIRHGHAGFDAPSDAERQLSDQGKHQVKEAADSLKTSAPDLILSSPFLRAQQTAAILQAAVGTEQPITLNAAITPSGDPFAVCNLLATFEHHSVIWVISHNPLLSELVNLLVNGNLSGQYCLDTASVACLEFESPVAVGLGSLAALTHAV